MSSNIIRLRNRRQIVEPKDFRGEENLPLIDIKLLIESIKLVLCTVLAAGIIFLSLDNLASRYISFLN